MRAGGEEYAYHISKLLTDPDEDTRRKAVTALGRQKAEDFAFKLAKCLEDPDREVRHRVVDALAELGQRGAEALSGQLHHIDSMIRSRAVAAMARSRKRSGGCWSSVLSSRESFRRVVFGSKRIKTRS